MLRDSARFKTCTLAVLTLTLLATIVPSALACTMGDETRAINIAKREVGADRDTHIFVAVAQGEDCDDWVVQKRTPGVRGEIACIVTIENWEVVDVLCCPTGCN